MNLKSLHLSAACLLLMSSISLAQSSVNVDPLTGGGNVVIPIYTVSSGQVSASVSLVYNGTGVKPKDVEGTAGMNWNLQGAGGQVSRLVRGLPDDVTKDNSGATMLGWMSTSNTGASYAANTLTIQNDGGVTCSKETNDINNINNYIPYTDDTEPDIFYVSAPGLSCELLYNRADSAFHPVIYQDLVVSAIHDPTTHLITSFTITNDKGIKYTFGQPEGVIQKTILGTGGTASYFATKYKQYLNGVTYYDSWALTSITDPNGNGVTFSYIAAPVRNSTDPVILFIGGSTTQAVQYFIQQAVTPQTLYQIGTTNANTSTTYLTFGWSTFSGAGQTGQTVISGITGMGRSFQFTYSSVGYYNPGTGNNYYRGFLRSFTDPGCSTPINYRFNYNGETYNSGTGAYTTTLVDSASALVDYWGYYSSNASSSILIPSVYVLNPVISYYPRYVIDASGSPGADYIYALLATNNRAVTTTSVTAGALNKVSYLQGGSTTITYESNDYFDPVAGSVMEGGGIRVKQIIDSVSTGSTNNIVRNYTYVNPAGVTNAGLSSGEPLTLPQFAFTIPYSGSATGLTLWTDATALSAYDLSNDDHTIMYAYSKVSQTGAGSTLYNFSVPETYWSLSNPTLNYVGRYTCTATYGPIKNYDYSYPFIPNPNYEFDRGQPLSVINYNDAGTKVSETDYTYTTSYSPSTITAFKADDGGPSGLIFKGYNKYIVNYGSSALAATVINKVFDSPTLSVAHADTTIYTYGSNYHKLVSQVQKTNSDRSIVNTYLKYIKDYAPNNGSNLNIKAMYYLQQLHVNTPVETYQNVTRGGTTVTTGASLTLFSPSTNGAVTNYLPSQQLKMVQPDGASFTPFSINTSLQTTTADAKYFPVVNYDQYDNTGFPLTVDDNNKRIQTTFFDHLTNHPTASFKNAKYNEAAFQDFDSQFATPQSTFTISGSGSYTPVGSHAGNAGGLASAQTETSGTLAKNSIAQNYIFSIWINPSSSGTLTLTLTGIASHPTISYSGGWKYYELKIPVGTLSSSYTVSFTANTNISIDDILFYPDVAEAATATYDATAHYKIAQTNTNGVSAYFTNDEWGRVLYAYDQDHNIVQKNTFITPADIASYIPVISYNSTATLGVPTGFNISGINACTSAGTVTWHFGDGTSANAVLGVSASHTYTTAKIDTVTATVTSSLFGTKNLGPVYVTVNIPLSYTTHASSHGDISSVVFSQGGVTKYSFTGSQLNTAGVLPGNYTIQVVLSDGQEYNSGTHAGYVSIDLNGNCGDWCQNWHSTPVNTYTFSADISSCTSLAFTVNISACGS